MLNKTEEAPFVPSQDDNFYNRINRDWNDNVDQSLSQKPESLQLFKGYNFDEREAQLSTTQNIESNRNLVH